MPKRTGRPFQRMKARVIRRDGGICHLCGQPGADSADHIVATANGGTDTPDNLAAVHHNIPPFCNRVRGARPIEVARADIAATQTTTQGWRW